jgi:hypothetical protein
MPIGNSCLHSAVSWRDRSRGQKYSSFCHEAGLQWKQLRISSLSFLPTHYLSHPTAQELLLLRSHIAEGMVGRSPLSGWTQAEALGGPWVEFYMDTGILRLKSHVHLPSLGVLPFYFWTSFSTLPQPRYLSGFEFSHLLGRIAFRNTWALESPGRTGFAKHTESGLFFEKLISLQAGEESRDLFYFQMMTYI